MSYIIKFSDDAEKVVAKYKKSNPIAYKKLSRLLNELVVHPRTGIGHLESLANGNDIRYSRRISANNRIVYDIYGD
ncbi:MAG: type II toxin-antitoxin system YoeB family toxin [Candidatus Symbiothrix sp.]|jgi:toxin YoeB|nr:type II toxin-antitoxin system YoeB family toxin [Candidatus Symbiothrix sp.]